MKMLGKLIGYKEKEISGSTELEVGHVYEVEVSHEVNLVEFEVGQYTMLECKQRAYARSLEIELKTSHRLWDKIHAQGHKPIGVEVTVNDIEMRIGAMVVARAVIHERFQFQALHASPIAISITVTWTAVILVGLIVAWLTSPYWGPLFWRIAGYDPGEIPPTPPIIPGLDEGATSAIIIVIVLIALIFLLWKLRK